MKHEFHKFGSIFYCLGEHYKEACTHSHSIVKYHMSHLSD